MSVVLSKEVRIRGCVINVTLRTSHLWVTCPEGLVPSLQTGPNQALYWWLKTNLGETGELGEGDPCSSPDLGRLRPRAYCRHLHTWW